MLRCSSSLRQPAAGPCPAPTPPRHGPILQAVAARGPLHAQHPHSIGTRPSSSPLNKHHHQQQRQRQQLSPRLVKTAAAASDAGGGAAATTAGQRQQQQQSFSVANPEGGPAFPITVQVPPGSEVYQVALKKPLGLTLTENAGGVIAVDELQQGGHAQQAGITVGDVLLAVTARAQVPGSSSPQLVLLGTQGQPFKAVAAGLRSNTCAQCSIVLLLQRQRQQQ